MLTLQDSYVQGCALILILGLQVRVIIWQQLLCCGALTILQAATYTTHDHNLACKQR
jgi:hypothetical protein